MHSFINRSPSDVTLMTAFYCNIQGNVKQMFKLHEQGSVYMRHPPGLSSSTEKNLNLLYLCPNLVSITCEIVVQ